MANETLAAFLSKGKDQPCQRLLKPGCKDDTTTALHNTIRPHEIPWKHCTMALFDLIMAYDDAAEIGKLKENAWLRHDARMAFQGRFETCLAGSNCEPAAAYAVGSQSQVRSCYS
jgi:hypothetical protein